MQNNGFLVPCRLFSLLPSFPLPLEPHFKAARFLRKKHQKSSTGGRKTAVLTAHSGWRAGEDTIAVPRWTSWHCRSGLLLSFSYSAATQTQVRVSSVFTHSFSLCPKKCSNTESQQHLVGQSSEQRQCCKTGFPRAYSCPWCNFFRLTQQQ